MLLRELRSPKLFLLLSALSFCGLGESDVCVEGPMREEEALVVDVLVLVVEEDDASLLKSSREEVRCSETHSNEFD